MIPGQTRVLRSPVGHWMFSGSDALPGQYQSPQGFGIQFNMSDPVEAVQMALQVTFLALRFGALVDQFGIPWFINCEKPP